MIFINAGQSCDAQVFALNAVLDACPEDAPAPVTCKSDIIGSLPVVASNSCAGTAAAINAALREFRGPAGDDETVECAFGEMLYDSTACEETVATLNAMIEAFSSGGFQNCEVTTPTTRYCIRETN